MITDPTNIHIELTQVLERFPVDAALIGHLVACDESVLSLCEDYSMARSTLAHFADMQEVAQRVDIADYQALVAELEREITEVLRNAK